MVIELITKFDAATMDQLMAIWLVGLAVAERQPTLQGADEL